MNPRPFALVAGIVLTAVGACAFVPALAPAETDALRVAAGVGGAQTFGIFPSTPVLGGIQAGLGIAGLIGATSGGLAVLYARAAGLILLALTIMGTIPGADTLFGLAPLYGNNLLLHGPLALLSLLSGWLYRRPRPLPQPGPPPEPERATF